MAIPASHIAKIQPRVMTGGSNDLEMNGLILSRSPLISASDLLMAFPSAATVSKFFGESSEEYEAAVVYFSGYQNRFSSPRTIFFARSLDEDMPAWLRGRGQSIKLEDLKKVRSGQLKISIDYTEISLDGLDFTDALSHSDVAEIISRALNAELPGAICEYSSLTEAFCFISPSLGENSQISFAVCSDPTLCSDHLNIAVFEADNSSAIFTKDFDGHLDLALFFALKKEQGAVISQGQKALNIYEQMTAIRKKSENWVTFSTAWETDLSEMLAWAKWANEHYGWLYIPWTTAKSTPISTAKNDPATLLKKSDYDHVALVYGSLSYACFIMGAVASVAWERSNGTITLAFKRQQGLAAWVNDELEAETLDSKNCNYFGNFATRNAEFIFLYPGCLSASDYGFIDAYINDIWLNNSIQVALMDGLSRTGIVPFTHRGYTLLRAWLMGPIKSGLNNRVIEAGVNLSELQRSELYQEAGTDISDELYTKGYFIQIKDPGAKTRVSRGSPITSVWYSNGGGIHKIELANTAVR